MKKLKECYNLYINTNIDKDVLKSVNDDIIKYTTEIEDILKESQSLHPKGWSLSKGD